jgi:hypothetical protein
MKQPDKGQEDEQDFEVIDMEKDLIRKNNAGEFASLAAFPPTTKRKVFIKQAKWEIYKQPTNEEEFESFYIGPIHFNASGSGFDFTEERNESMARRITEGLLDILFQHFDPLLSFPSQESIRLGRHTFSSAVRFSIIVWQHSVNYCLRHPDSTLSFDENIAFEVHVSNTFLGGKIWLFFSQYWNGKNPKRLPSLFEKVSASDSWAHDDIKRFRLTPDAKTRHRSSLEEWKKLYNNKSLFNVLSITLEERDRERRERIQMGNS